MIWSVHQVTQEDGSTIFYVLLTVHLGIIIVNNQLAYILFGIRLFRYTTCFEQPCVRHQENQLYQYDIWHMSLYVGDSM